MACLSGAIRLLGRISREGSCGLPCPAFREARGAGRLVSEEKLDPCTASARLIAHGMSGQGKTGVDEGMQNRDQRWGKHQAASPPGRVGEDRRQARQEGKPAARTVGQYCSWVVRQCLLSQPGDKGVLGRQGQSQLPELVLLDVLMVPSISAPLGGAARLCLLQAGWQIGHGA